MGYSESYTYDNNGNVLTKTDKNGTVTTNTYNGIDNVISTTVGEETTSYEYLEYGSPVKSITNSSGSITYSYNNKGMVTSEISAKGGGCDPTSVKLDGTKDTQLEGVSNVNNILTASADSSQDGAGETLKTYSYDKNGNQTNITISKDGRRLINQNNTYNSVGQLTEVKDNIKNEVLAKYSYDKAGNVTEKKQNGDSMITKYEYNECNLIKSVENQTISDPLQKRTGTYSKYTYDYYLDGNRLKETDNIGQTKTYTYDNAGRLTGEETDSQETLYSYDATGRRSGKTVNGQTTNHYWDGSDIVRETGVNNAIYYRGLNIIAQKAGNNISYYLRDAHGDTIGLAESTGSVRKDYKHDAFGNLAYEYGTSAKTPFRYNGQYTDDETGLIYLRNRYYDSATGRFTQEDPIKDGLNWYVYCDNDPVNYVDLNGYWKEGDENFHPLIIAAIIKYTNDWNYYDAIGDEDGKNEASAKAEAMRELGRQFVSREAWGAKNFDWDWDPDKTEIVIHHTANYNSVSEDEEKHISQGWDGIGYHFIIDVDGKVYEGRPFNAKGAHVDNNNTGKFGIVLVGNFEPKWYQNNQPTEEQIISLGRLIDVIDANIGVPLPIKGHRDYNGSMYKDTVCPGENLYTIIERMYM